MRRALLVGTHDVSLQTRLLGEEDGVSPWKLYGLPEEDGVSMSP